MNLRVLRPSRKAPRPGDIFAMQLPNGKYVFGRVILTDLSRERAPMPGAILIYVYRHLSSSKSPSLAQLRPDALAVPPIFTNRLAWTKGYFENLRQLPFRPSDLLERHCFLRWDGRFLNLDGEVIPNRLEPCGDWALTSYRMIDDMVSDGFGIGRAPESP